MGFLMISYSYVRKDRFSSLGNVGQTRNIRIIGAPSASQVHAKP